MYSRPPAPPAPSLLAPVPREPYYGAWAGHSVPQGRPARAESPPAPMVPRKRPAQDDNDGSDQDDAPGIGRRRSLTTPFQAQILRAFISITRFPATALRDEVGAAIGLTGRQVQVWFQNQRQKARKLVPAIDLDNDVFPLGDLLASQPLAASAYSSLTQRAIPHLVTLNEEISQALSDAGITATSQRLTPEALNVVALYCSPSGGPGPHADKATAARAGGLSASSDSRPERSRMPPPPVPVQRPVAASHPAHPAASNTKKASSPLRFSHFQARPQLILNATPSARPRSPSPPPSPPRDPDLVLPPLLESNMQEALSLPAESRPVELESAHSPPLRPRQSSPPYDTEPDIAPVRSAQPAASPKVPVLLIPKLHADKYIPARLQVIPRLPTLRERQGIPDWMAHGPEGDAALDPELVDKLKRMSVWGNRRRPAAWASRPEPTDGTAQPMQRRWVWGSEIKPKRGEPEPVSWEWEWEAPSLEVPDFSGRPTNRHRLVGEHQDSHGLFTWLATGRFAGKQFYPANGDLPPAMGEDCAREGASELRRTSRDRD